MARRYRLPIPFGWYGIAFSEELPAGEVRILQYVGRDLVAFRTESGQARVVDAHCPHLGAHLGHGGEVVGENIRCPFHHWEFDGEGVCRKVPYAKRIPARVNDGGGLYAYPTVEKNGVVWAWYHPERADPSFEVAELDELNSDEWSDYRHFDWTVNAAVQETAENAADAAHFAYVHQSREVPVGEITLDGPRRWADFPSKVPAMNPDGSLDTTGTRWRENHLHTANYGPGMTWQRFTGLFDTVMLGLITPIRDDQLHMRFAFKQRKGMTEGQLVMAKALVEIISSQVEQDIPIWDNKIYQPAPRLCDGDGPIAEFRKWFRQFYTANEIAASDLAPSAGE